MAKRIEFTTERRATAANRSRELRRPTADKLDEIAARSPKDREALETMIDEVIRRLDAHEHPHAM